MNTEDCLKLLATELSGAPDFQELASRVVKACAAVASAELSTFWRAYEDVDARGARQPRLRLAAAFGVEAPQALAQEVTYAITLGRGADRRYDGLTGYVASERKVVHIRSFAELRQEYGFCHSGKMDDIQWKGTPSTKMRNLYALPLLLGDEILGVLKVENHLPAGDFTELDRANMDAIGERVALVAKAMALLDSHESELVDAPARLAKALARPFEMSELTQTIVETTATTLDAEVCSLWLVDATGKLLVHQADYGIRGDKSAVPSYVIYPADTPDAEIEGITAWVATRRKAFWANSHEVLRRHDSWRGRWDEPMFGGKKAAEKKFRSLYAVPLLWHDEILGVLKVENPRTAPHLTPADHLKIEQMANYVVLLLVLTRQFRLQIVPELAHILNSSTVAVAEFIREIERELAREQPDLEQVKHDVEIVKRLTLTIATMSLTLSGEVFGRFETQRPESHDLLAIFDEHIKLIEPLIPTGLSIVREYGMNQCSAPVTRSERAWLQIALFNLLHNAIKYSPPGGSIRVEAGRQAGETTIAVVDQGPGIDPGILPSLFEPNVRKSRKGWPLGTGLGLFTVRRLLGQMGWEVTAGNLEPRGARFQIRIPAGWREKSKG